MRDVGVARAALRAAECQQALIGQVQHGALERLRAVGVRAQGVERLLAAGVGPARAELHQAQKDAPRNRLLGGIERGQRGVGAARQHNMQAGTRARARQHNRFVGGQRQAARIEPIPEEAQRFLHNWQHARLAGGIGHQPLGQRRLDMDAHRLGRLHNRGAQAARIERHNLDALALDQGPQRREHQVGVEIGAHRQRHVAARLRHQRQNGLLELRGVGWRGGKHFLELVDYQQQAGVLGARQEREGIILGCFGQGRQRRAARAHGANQPLALAKERAAAQRGDQPGKQERRLAAAGRADQRQEGVQMQARQQVLHLGLASEKEFAGVFAEGHHAGVGAGRARRGRARGAARRHQRVEVGRGQARHPQHAARHLHKGFALVGREAQRLGQLLRKVARRALPIRFDLADGGDAVGHALRQLVLRQIKRPATQAHPLAKRE